MMLEKVRVVADIFFALRHSPGEEAVHCLCSRAFVQDRELYRSDNRLLCSDLTDAQIQEEDGEEDEGDDEDEVAEEVLDEEAQLMASMGLPLAFGSSCSQLRMGRRSNRKPARYCAAPPAVDEDEEHRIEDEKEEVSDPHGGRGGGEEETQNIQDVGWENYWAQQGQTLLWQGWLEKHPESQLSSTECPEMVTAPWDNPDTKAAWDQHATETYYYYWEQYSYWAAQGWTAEQPVCSEDTDEQPATGGTAGETDTHTEDGRHGQAGGCDDLTGQNCKLEAGACDVVDLIGQMSLHTQEVTGQRDDAEQQDGAACGNDQPCDGGNDHTKAASSSAHSTAENTGSLQGRGSLDRQNGSGHKRMSNDKEDDDDDKDPGGGQAKLKRR